MKNNSTDHITIVGLGPGNSLMLTRQAWKLFQDADEIWLRTIHHPVVQSLPAHIKIHSFDHLYEQNEKFKQVYENITDEIIQLSRRPGGVIYAVPGHPYVAEATCPAIIKRAEEDNLSIEVIPGISFLEPVLSALELDVLPQTVIVDALELADLIIPPFPPSFPAIIAQIHSRMVASEIKLTLGSVYPDEHLVFLVHAAGTEMELIEHLSLYEIDRSEKIGLLTALYVPPLSPVSSFEAFQEVIARLRAPDGCPWDREQTHLSLRQYLLEETYEALAALDEEDPQSMMEEFGDLLLQVVLHAQIATESGDFTMKEILAHIHQKIVRRHPHVFGSIQANDTSVVLQNWEKLKAAEREEKGQNDKSLLDGIALTLPALLQAKQYLSRTARVGFDWPNLESVVAKVQEEFEEVCNAPEERKAFEIGDLMFAITNLARWFDVDPESALRETNLRFKARFGYIENWAKKNNRSIETLSIKEMLDVWDESKALFS